jgi:hypothetical protein
MSDQDPYVESETVAGDRVDLHGGNAYVIKSGETRLERSAANTVYAQDLEARQSAVAWAEADQVSTRQSLIGHVQAEQASVDRSAVGVLSVKTVTLTNASAGILVATQANLENASAVVVISRAVDGQPVLKFDPRTAVVAGAAAGGVLGLLWLVGRLFGKR